MAKRGRGPIRLLVGLVLLRGGLTAWVGVHAPAAKPDGIPVPGSLRPPRSSTPTGTP